MSSDLSRTTVNLYTINTLIKRSSSPRLSCCTLFFVGDGMTSNLTKYLRNQHFESQIEIEMQTLKPLNKQWNLFEQARVNVCTWSDSYAAFKI